ncbi:DVUA0089 family protein [Nitrosospira sp. Is2]|uniref:DVUA0089 family protein n=1 Tax=Nitrosospira sp. Is2 TaxID=3080532 RepID=UPI0029545B8B|nr:DVUA0089 family protein [Nitrosospira sp. Is2]WON74089.1 DVUA0089 family protein [Nitrosospira sp. Is2]
MKTYKALVAISLISGSANAADFSFIGNFGNANEVQEFNFAVTGAAREVTLRTWSYAGGSNSEGTVIARGGFDPMVTLFAASSGARIGFSDDGGALSARDPVSGHTWDSFLTHLLSPGSYTATVTQYSNFPRGSLTDGFQGTGHTGFNGRDSHWALDVLNVEGASLGSSHSAPVSSVPEPESYALLLAGLAVVSIASMRREAAQPPL